MSARNSNVRAVEGASCAYTAGRHGATACCVDPRRVEHVSEIKPGAVKKIQKPGRGRCPDSVTV
ncbi:MAG TPA: hypothetical protein VE441_10130, partial [Mycobacterium sp.]|nr:hypothetical protein [Mycobacterium sp.]